MESQWEKVLGYFEEICKIPRSSGNEQGISDYLVEFGESRGFEVSRDASLNVLLKKKGSPGYEEAPSVILQGHLDMVCVSGPDTDIDFSKQGITTKRSGKWLHAEGTSLGADNGIAAAYILALLDSDDVSHPPIEALFTTGEETGMIGATALDFKNIKGKILINLDSEEEGEFMSGCAGGINTTVVLPIVRRHVEKRKQAYKVVVSGLTGGHSGIEIKKQRANAIKLMGRLLHELIMQSEFSIGKINGGSKLNAIPVETEAVLYPEDPMELKSGIAYWEKIFKNEFKATDPDLKITVEKVQDVLPVLDKASQQRITDILLLLPNGVQTMSKEVEGLVQSSNNVGVLHTTEKEIHMVSCPRSSINSLKRDIIRRIETVAALCGGRVINEHDYPEWEYVPDSRIRKIFVETYKELYGRKAIVRATHAGLECGILGKKIEDLDMISVGPDMKDVHTINEKLDLESAERTWKLLAEVLKKLK